MSCDRRKRYVSAASRGLNPWSCQRRGFSFPRRPGVKSVNVAAIDCVACRVHLISASASNALMSERRYRIERPNFRAWSNPAFSRRLIVSVDCRHLSASSRRVKRGSLVSANVGAFAILCDRVSSKSHLIVSISIDTVCIDEQPLKYRLSEAPSKNPQRCLRETHAPVYGRKDA